MSSLLKDAMRRGQNMGIPRPPLPALHENSHQISKSPRGYTPVNWSNYFQTKQKIHIGEDNEENFCIYRASNANDVSKTPVVLFLHGGGYSALTWSLTVEHLLSFITCEIIALDLRGHGETKLSGENNLQNESLTKDLISLTKALDLEDRPLVIVGHSLGGAVAIHFAAAMNETREMGVVALVVIDVVEGSALESLVGMNLVLKNRPTTFPNLEKAIEWCVRTGQTRNLESARVSMPGQLKYVDTSEPATTKVFPDLDKEEATWKSQEEPGPNRHTSKASKNGGSVHGAIQEEEEMPPPPAIHDVQVPKVVESGGFTWRLDLLKTEPYWAGWFEGISTKFLDIPCPKLLLLAGVDRLDRDLTVGQMQGKFQMHVLPNVGHAVHEDSPEQVARNIAGFLVRHKLSEGKIEFPSTFPGC